MVLLLDPFSWYLFRFQHPDFLHEGSDDLYAQLCDVRVPANHDEEEIDVQQFFLCDHNSSSAFRTCCSFCTVSHDAEMRTHRSLILPSTLSS